jgi:hypothetical protein
VVTWPGGSVAWTASACSGAAAVTVIDCGAVPSRLGSCTTTIGPPPPQLQCGAPQIRQLPGSVRPNRMARLSPKPRETLQLFVRADVEFLVQHDPVERVKHGALLSLWNRRLPA